ncbi:NAD(P)/FAD-dependent oxidoreductase [Paenibacillus brevis]|uniref:FAD-dependent oxidoreductase n=1 Tax=Paenibacillus brevis TaxID=2841508 RepID=A0ABS6FWL3_9BACL|nr:FAD-dependent oxidoreductase [Paenibacillus brevis]MBU5674622.1 FAD-dependent oxidoreductase [Paenibacillus brevis]
MTRLVVLGGGYGGTTVIHEIFKGRIPLDLEVTLVDRQPCQSLKTEYYALAAGTVSDHELRVSFPDYPGLRLRYGEVVKIDLEQRLIVFDHADQPPLEYDQLVIALGCTDNYHQIAGAKQFSCSIQSFAATRQTYVRLNNAKPYSHIHIVGGGLSGVEIAAELRESRPDLDISLIDRGTRLLSAFPAKVSDYVTKWFEEHDIRILSQISIHTLEEGVIRHDSGSILSDVTVWTAGIRPVEPVQRLELPKDPQGRIKLNSYHQIPEYPEVFVCGDCASLPFAPSAQAAGVQGEQIAQVLLAQWSGENPRLQPMRLKGTLGSLGKKAGFGLMGKAQVTGRVPRLLKSGVLWKSKRHRG